jgi:hypothetical protein
VRAVDPNERWQALQSSLHEARAAWAAGDRDRALKAVDATLAIDPDYLAAQSLRDRLLATADAPPAPVADSVARSSKLYGSSAGNYALFEERVRRRRVQRRLEAARRAIAHSRFALAAAAVRELREADPQLPDLPALEEAIARGQESWRLGNSRLNWAVATAFGLALLTASTLQDDPVRPLSSPADFRAVETSDLALPSSGPVETTAAVTQLPVKTDGGPNVEEQRVVPARSYAVQQQARPVPPVEPAETASAAPLLDAAAGPETRASFVALPPPPLPTALSGPVRSAPTPTRTLPDQQLVEQTLQRYRLAYEDLDAASASAVWPAVDEAALARAFDGLVSQALTFENCDVRVDGNAATAACSGTARYIPKVGSRQPRVEPRRWNFSLRKRGSDWQIENARAER